MVNKVRLVYKNFEIEQCLKGYCRFDLSVKVIYKTKEGVISTRMDSLGYSMTLERCVELIALIESADATNVLDLISKMRVELKSISENLERSIKELL